MDDETLDDQNDDGETKFFGIQNAHENDNAVLFAYYNKSNIY
jgi:hypothetical protein